MTRTGEYVERGVLSLRRFRLILPPALSASRDTSLSVQGVGSAIVLEDETPDSGVFPSAAGRPAALGRNREDHELRAEG